MALLCRQMLVAKRLIVRFGSTGMMQISNFNFNLIPNHYHLSTRPGPITIVLIRDIRLWLISDLF